MWVWLALGLAVLIALVVIMSLPRSGADDSTGERSPGTQSLHAPMAPVASAVTIRVA